MCAGGGLVLADYITILLIEDMCQAVSSMFAISMDSYKHVLFYCCCCCRRCLMQTCLPRSFIHVFWRCWGYNKEHVGLVLHGELSRQQQSLLDAAESLEQPQKVVMRRMRLRMRIMTMIMMVKIWLWLKLWWLSTLTQSVGLSSSPRFKRHLETYDHFQQLVQKATWPHSRRAMTCHRPNPKMAWREHLQQAYIFAREIPELVDVPITLWLCQNSHWKWQFIIYSGFSH